jgi:type VI secretion system secreted protein Hcp
MANVDAFFTITGATGESNKSGVEGWIEVESFSWGGSNPSGVTHGSGSGTGKWDPQSLTIVKSVDSATPSLFKLNTTGSHAANATLLFRQSTGGSTTQTYFQYDMTEAFIDSISWSGSEHSESGKPQETITVSAKKHVITYTKQNPDGSMGSPVENGFDVTTNSVV